MMINESSDTTTTVYHPLKRQQQQLVVVSPTQSHYRSRANSNIIERRYSNLEQRPSSPPVRRKICE